AIVTLSKALEQRSMSFLLGKNWAFSSEGNGKGRNAPSRIQGATLSLISQALQFRPRDSLTPRRPAHWAFRRGGLSEIESRRDSATGWQPIGKAVAFDIACPSAPALPKFRARTHCVNGAEVEAD